MAGSIDCGYVIVPEGASAPAGRQVKLGFLRLKATRASKAAPVFMLAGGPGSSMITPDALALFAPEFLGPLRETRDIVILDQRGTRHTVPHLDCSELGSLGWLRVHQGLDDAAAEALEGRLLERCVRRFRGQGVDLAQYNSVAIAADIDAARRALRYERIVYYGASYGAQLGQHVMRDFPGMLESVILDGANALSRRSWIEDRALDVDYAIGHVADLCRSDEKCRNAYDIPAMIDRGLAQFDDGPLTGSFASPDRAAKPVAVRVSRTDFIDFVYHQQGYKIGVASLPAALHTLLQDGRASMAKGLAGILGEAAVAQRAKPQSPIAFLMHLAVVCSDDPVRSTAELVTTGVRSRYALLFGERAAREYVRNCAIVDVPSLPDATDRDVTTNVPTLILSGGLDAQTPTFRSETVARALPDARLVVFADGTHVQLGAANVCAARIVNAFVANPRGPLPLDCVGESRFPGFVLPDGSMSR